MSFLRHFSENLKPIYKLELSLGNEVLRVDEPAGSECPLAVVFRFPIHFKEINKELSLPGIIEQFESRDHHYPSESGFYCKETKHAVIGPISGEYPKDRPIS